MEGLNIRLLCWEDGELQEKSLDKTDRWVIHTAHELQLTLSGVTIRLKQQPHGLNATRLGVGACIWEGELLLAAYLASLPHHRYIGARCIELGSGPGLAGLMLAKLGAKVVLTDIAKVLPLIQENVELNGLNVTQRKGAVSGVAEVEELEWGSEGYEARAVSLASSPMDLVFAADCCYIDNEGQSPSTPAFIKTCYHLCGPKTKCFVSFELRSEQVKKVFLEEAGKVFAKVTRVPPSQLPKGCQVQHIELYELAH